MGYEIGHNIIGDLSRQSNYSLQSNRKTKDGTHNPDRDAQFGYINTQVKAALAPNQPAISVKLRKNNLLATSKTPAANFPQRLNPSRFGCMISKSPNLAARHPTASSTSRATQAA